MERIDTWILRLSERAFSRLKWSLTALSALMTSGVLVGLHI